MTEEYEQIAHNIYEDAKDHFRKTKDLNYFSQYYPNDRIDFLNDYVSKLAGDEMECNIEYPIPCVSRWIMCIWPPPNHSRIVCQRHRFIDKNSVNNRLI
jgi:hypothetical protein